ncbi:hypothetical protein ACR3GP_002899 [Yersinia enterocolitica]
MNNIEELFIANAELAAELLQHMADNEIDSDYFAVVTDSPNCGREVQSEHSVTEVALMAAGIIEQLIAQLEAAQKERDDLHGILNIERGGSAFESKRTAYIDGMCDKWRERAEKAEAQLIKAEKGEVLVTVSGFTGCGKSAVAGEIEIALLAIGVPVRWTNGDAEKRMTGADYLTALEMYKPHVRIVERNIAGGKWYE